MQISVRAKELKPQDIILGRRVSCVEDSDTNPGLTVVSFSEIASLPNYIYLWSGDKVVIERPDPPFTEHDAIEEIRATLPNHCYGYDSKKALERILNKINV